MTYLPTLLIDLNFVSKKFLIIRLDFEVAKSFAIAIPNLNFRYSICRYSSIAFPIERRLNELIYSFEIANVLSKLK